MYHYVRPTENTSLRYLNLTDFQKQLDWLKAKYGNFLSREDWEAAKDGKPIRGVLLTFDDGLKDHFNYVLPELLKREIFAIFFVCTDPIIFGKPLPVHIAHKLIATGDSRELLEFIKEKVPSSIWIETNKNNAKKAYLHQKELEPNILIKKVINYLFTSYDSTKLLNECVGVFMNQTIDDFVSDWYMSEKDILETVNSGYLIGSHTCSHRLLSSLDKSQIHKEIFLSKVILENIIKSRIDEFCYPYGGKKSYNLEVVEVLKESGFGWAHDVNPQAIQKIHLEEKYFLPRFDCNRFPFGISESLKI